MRNHLFVRGLAATAFVGGLLAGGIGPSGPASAATAPTPTTPIAPTTPPAGTFAGADHLGTFDGMLLRPIGVAVSGKTAYISDGADNVVVREDAVGADANPADFAVVAGNTEKSGESGDGGPATDAGLTLATGLATDRAGNLYFADTEDNVVREVDSSTGIIHLVAGTGAAGSRSRFGLATRTQLDSPQGVAVNAAGDVFVADTVNNRILEVFPNGRIAPYAGTGIAGFRGDGGRATRAELDFPTGLALDARGDLYVADSSNNVIRRVDARTGIITTVAGDVAADRADDGLGGFGGDGGPATRARLHDPQGVALDGAGDLFIADTFNDAVREVTPDGRIFTVVGSASANGGAPTAGPGSEPTTTGTPATSLELNTPEAVAVQPSTGDLLVVDTIDDAVAVITGLGHPGDASGPTAR